MKTILLLLIFTISSAYCIGQDKEEEVITTDGCATYSGGEPAMTEYIKNNLKYPEYAQKMGIGGRVIIRFIVEMNGSVTNVELVRGIDPHCDNEALRVVNSMPKWVPCRPSLRPARCQFTMPVHFKLVDNDIPEGEENSEKLTGKISILKDE
ncbi:energy transducer TonB [Dysgonomonas sp. 521]|uniref:energy transducer TonB n=1 Tax=Dysgonomonas sp. 521 TaxID=2302932 RepID=UPI0013D475C0|nr:energy transducer TonB [Dysgonomonas sp. 521]